MTVRQQADHDQQEDDKYPEDDLNPPVPEGGNSVDVPGLPVVVRGDWCPASADPLPLDWRAGHSVAVEVPVSRMSPVSAHLGRGGGWSWRLTGANSWYSGGGWGW